MKKERKLLAVFILFILLNWGLVFVKFTPAIPSYSQAIGKLMPSHGTIQFQFFSFFY
ncbi:MAG: hypothetical protein SFW35_05880 [Chitinophagales bacterium]|nr:hypothetical protein [Chitinophagales bacterium]